MLKMAQIQYIKHLYENKEKSLREIARITEMSFQTVQKYANRDDWSADPLPNTDAENYPVLGKYIPIIDKILEDDRRAPRKQRHTAQRIYTRLREEHRYNGSYSSVKEYVRKKKTTLAADGPVGYLPLGQPQAHAQVDFGEFHYNDISGADKLGYALTLTFPYSNMGFTQVFPSQNQECLLEGMKRIFLHIGGVPIRIRADNMTTAVAHVLKGTERELTDGFTRFMLHYRFQADFCNPAAGNEKGSVENKVGYSRRNYFVPVPTITDFSGFNEELWTRCEEDGERLHYKRKAPLAELWEEERPKLLFLPEYEYQVFRYESVRVNNYGFVYIETNSYGLSPTFAGQTAQAKIYFDHIELYYDHLLLKTYPRSYERNTEVLDWTQYLGVLCRKPGAVEHTRFFNQLPKLWREHLVSVHGKERKSALMLLKEIVDDGNSRLCDEAISFAGECGRTDEASIRQCYYMLSKKENHPQPLLITVAAPLLNYNPDLVAYDSLTGGGANG